MQTHRLTTLVTLGLTALILQACNRDAPVQSEPVAQAPSTETTTSIYDWHARGVPAGETTIVRAGDGRVTTEAFVHWNNREYRLQSELQLDADGMVVSQHITGVSPFGATVDESFSYTDGEANWRTVGESGSAQSTRAAFYVPTEWGAVGSVANWHCSRPAPRGSRNWPMSPCPRPKVRPPSPCTPSAASISAPSSPGSTTA
jgi:hypothetical protein